MNTLLSHIIQYATEQKYSYALWRLPNKFECYIGICKEEEQNSRSTVNDHLNFVLKPFEGDAVYLKFDYLISYNLKNGNYAKIVNNVLIEKEISMLSKRLECEVEKTLPFSFKVELNTEKDKQYFINKVKKAKQLIDQKEIKKVVLSRQKKVKLTNINVDSFFERLCKAHENAFITACFLVKEETLWIGATPERLLHYNGSELHTVSLAGTQKVKDNIAKKKVHWEEKEKKEQQFVTDYIVECLNKSDITNLKVGKQETILAGKIAHIKTSISGVVPQNKISKILQDLHPTPAVGGIPKAKALRFISENERNEREFYSGYIGVLQEKELNLFVNIRNMKIQKDIGTIYIGCGITEGSDPAKEFEETEAKSMTLLNVLEECVEK